MGLSQKRDIWKRFKQIFQIFVFVCFISLARFYKAINGNTCCGAFGTATIYTENIYQYSLNLKHIPDFAGLEMGEVLLINTIMFEDFCALGCLLVR